MEPATHSHQPLQLPILAIFMQQRRKSMQAMPIGNEEQPSQRQLEPSYSTLYRHESEVL